LVRWPGHVSAGRVDETSVVGGVDWLPTICKLTGATVPTDWKLDGEDVSDIWLGQTRPRQKPLMWEWLIPVIGMPEYQPPPLAIRRDNWKLFCDMKGGKAELYDIPNDPSELHDVAAAHPDIVKALSAEVLAWQHTLPPSPLRDQAAAGVKTPTPNRPAKGKKKS
jgi:arylsulfatase A-like enzyme